MAEGDEPGLCDRYVVLGMCPVGSSIVRSLDRCISIPDRAVLRLDGLAAIGTVLARRKSHCPALPFVCRNLLPCVYAMGQKQTFRSAIAMSALPPKADVFGATRNVRYGSKAEIQSRLFDDLISKQKQLRADGEPSSPSGVVAGGFFRQRRMRCIAILASGVRRHACPTTRRALRSGSTP